MASSGIRHLFFFVCATAFCLRLGHSQSNDGSSNDTQQCVKQLLQWCKNNSYPEEEGSMSMISTYENINGLRVRVNCRTDFEGTMCRKNKSSWFHCYPDKTMQYKGEWLKEDSAGDSEVCYTKIYASRFRVNNQFNSTAFQEKFNKGMQQFHHQMADFRNKMREMSQRFPFFSNFGFPWAFGDLSDESDESDSIETESDFDK